MICNLLLIVFCYVFVLFIMYYYELSCCNFHFGLMKFNLTWNQLERHRELSRNRNKRSPFCLEHCCRKTQVFRETQGRDANGTTCPISTELVSTESPATIFNFILIRFKRGTSFKQQRFRLPRFQSLAEHNTTIILSELVVGDEATFKMNGQSTQC